MEFAKHVLKIHDLHKDFNKSKRKPESTIKDGCSWRTDEFQHVGSIQCSENQASTTSGADMGALYYLVGLFL